MPLFDRLDDFALSLARPVTVPLLRQMLAESPSPIPSPSPNPSDTATHP